MKLINNHLLTKICGTCLESMATLLRSNSGALWRLQKLFQSQRGPPQMTGYKCSRHDFKFIISLATGAKRTERQVNIN